MFTPSLKLRSYLARLKFYANFFVIAAGSFPHTLFQCLRDMHISGTSAKNSGLIRWFPSGSATRLFQLVLGDGQHAFLAHGEIKTCLILTKFISESRMQDSEVVRSLMLEYSLKLTYERCK